MLNILVFGADLETKRPGFYPLLFFAYLVIERQAKAVDTMQSKRNRYLRQAFKNAGVWVSSFPPNNRALMGKLFNEAQRLREVRISNPDKWKEPEANFISKTFYELAIKDIIKHREQFATSINLLTPA